MTALFGFLLSWATRSALAILLAAGACALARHKSAELRNMLWRGALACTLCIGLGLSLSPAVGIKLSSAAPTVNAVLAPSFPPHFVRTSDAATSVNPSSVYAGNHVEIASAAGNPIWWILGGVYALGAMIVVLRWLASMWLILAACRQAKRQPGTDDILLTDARDFTVPFTFGWWRPVIVLPADARDWADNRRAAVILHERSHVRRSDWIWQTAAALTAALQWFNPAAWLLSGQIRSTAEEAADNDVLSTGIAPSAYAAELLEFATSRPVAAVAVTSMVRNVGLGGRVKRVLAVGIDRRRAGVRFALTTGIVFGLTGLVLAAFAATPANQASRLAALFQSQGEAKFASGAQLKVVYVGYSVDSTLPVWQYDGSPAGPNVKPSGRYSGGGKPGHRGICVGYYLTGSPARDDSDTCWPRSFRPMLGGLISNGGGSGGGADGMNGRAMFDVPEGWQLADFSFGLGIGPFKKVADSADGSLSIQVKPGEESRGRNVVNGQVIVSPHRTSEIDYILPESVANRDWRLLAIDREGKDESLYVPFDPVPDAQGRRVAKAYCNMSPESIERLVITARDFEWATVKNIHLFPGHSVKP